MEVFGLGLLGIMIFFLLVGLVFYCYCFCGGLLVGFGCFFKISQI